ncbi:MAG: hypothetical protein NTY18_08230 [Deltaproteobacteria bacterium]|nr:hypothetical protein [Deltaproteobacteria bacterium]
MAQSVPACQVRQADPLTTGWQRRTWFPVALQVVASSGAQAFTVGQVHAAPLPVSVHVVPGSLHTLSVCQVRQADPLTTGLQRSTWSPPGLHWLASSVVQAFTVGHVQAEPPPLSTQEAPGSVHAAEEASYQQALALERSWAQETS